MPKIRTTIRPEDEIDVSDAEAEHLDRLGVVLKTKATTDEGARRAAVNTKKESE